MIRDRVAGPGSATAGVPLGLDGCPREGSPHEEVERLLEDLRAGAIWDEAFGAYWRSLGGPTDPTVRWPPPHGRLNWIWLTDLGPLRAAVDLGSPFGTVAFDLVGEVQKGGSVSYLGRPSVYRDAVELRFQATEAEVALRVREGTGSESTPGDVDCVVFVGSEGYQYRLPEGWTEPEALVGRARELLRSGGWFVVLLPSPFANLRSPRAWSRPSDRLSEIRRYRQIVKALETSGFQEVRHYHSAPSLDVLGLLVPVDLTAVRGFLNARRPPRRAPQRVRPLLHPFLFPVRVLLARA